VINAPRLKEEFIDSPRSRARRSARYDRARLEAILKAMGRQREVDGAGEKIEGNTATSSRGSPQHPGRAAVPALRHMER